MEFSPVRRTLRIIAVTVISTILVAACNLPTPTISAPPSPAGDVYVNPSGDDSNDCLSPGRACATIRAAFSKASSGDTIAIGIGSYPEELVLDKDIELLGSGPGNTELDGGGSHRLISVDQADVGLHDLGLGNGQATKGGCILNEGTLSLDSVLIHDCQADEGAGIFNRGELTITNSQFQDNEARNRGAGLFHAMGSRNASLDGATFERNSAPISGDSSVGGGAIYNNAGMKISNSVFSDNHAKEAIFSLDGKLVVQGSQVDGNSFGGIHAFSSDPNVDASLELQDTDIVNQQTTGLQAKNTRLIVENGVIGSNGASGVEVSSAPADFTDVVIRDNGAALNTGNGGGMRLENTSVTVHEGEIQDNLSPEKGGGVFFDGVTSHSQLEITGTTIQGNQAAQGGGLFFASGSAHLIGASLLDNQAEQGGGIYAAKEPSLGESQPVDLTSVLLQGNQATNGDGGAVSNWTAFSADGTTFSSNSASGQGGAIYNGVQTLGASGGQPLINLINDTISGNQAQSGAGIANFGQMWIRFVTIARNDAASDGGGLLLSSNPPGGMMLLYNTILAENTSGNGGTENCSAPGGGFDGGNLEDLNTCGLSNANDKPNTDPQLGPLQNNGGVSTSLTHLPADTSPVIDAAILPPGNAPAPEDCPAIDQRGVNRPEGQACDIGAVEVESPPATPTPQVACQAELTFQDAAYNSISYRALRGGVLISLNVPGEISQQEYQAAVNGQAFQCSPDPDFPERLFCTGPRVTEGSEATIEVYGEGCSQPVFQATFSVPFGLYPTPTPTPSATPAIDITPTFSSE